MHDVNSMSKNYAFQLSNGKMGELENLTEETYGNMLNDQKQKNGFAFSAHNFSNMNGTFLKMDEKCKELISKIDNDLAK